MTETFNHFCKPNNQKAIRNQAEPEFSEYSDDVLIFMGDFNYRINGEQSQVLAMMQQNMYDLLRCNDQLNLEMKLGRMPRILKEGTIEFAPTFKRRPNKNTEFNLKRMPSWTDRILFANNPDKCQLA